MKRSGACGVVFVVMAAGCSRYSSATPVTNQADAGGTPSNEGGAADAGTVEAGTAVAAPPPNCDDTADSKSTAAAGCVDDNFAVFVDANAPAGGDGTKEKPLPTISAALAVAVPNGKQRIYVCGTSTFAEHVNITAANAARLIGGFDCKTWLPLATGMVPKLAPSDAGYALQVASVTSDFAVEDMSFEALAGTTASPSSIAVFVASSPNVTFTRVTMTANDGAPGTAGVPGSTAVSTPIDRNGNDAIMTAGGAAKTCTCNTGGSSTGGKGGDTDGAGIDGANGLPTISPPNPPAANGAGQTDAVCNVHGIGAQEGSTGPNGIDAVSPSLGTINASGWQAGNGGPAGNGKPGQGGGGGGGKTNGSASINGGGGGGSCGGCGGGGGGSGAAGGSSIALLLLQSPVKLDACVLTSGAGAQGGAGMPGAAGNSQLLGGAQANGGCSGASGGAGGEGGAGAGGAGGLSAAVLYSGAAPSADAASILTPGVKGNGGAGGRTGVNDGPSGLAGESVEAPQ